ncbi:MAG: WD40 repeat domain-containing protein [Gemmatimonadaceae bacterium]|nr:WD40 repeat domain-containing protein [Gemmatimonadaceae bacterium]
MTGHPFRQNPYVGIRPFFDEDSIFFFGRREQTKELLAGLGKSRFLTVLGSSGSGKSSLVRSGLIPTLQAGFLVGARTKWRMAKCRPGDAPLENLADALLRAAGKERTNDAIHACADALREGHLDAALKLLQPVVQADENVLVLMDQFEELFAFRSGASGEAGDEAATRDSTRVAERIRRRSEAASVVSLLLDLSAQSRVPVYIVLTMRTDFLGDTDVFPGLPEAINRSGYLVPRLTRSQLREAIEGPAQLLGARVEPRLVDRLVNDVGDRGDRLPLLQHALHRAWDAWDDEGRIGPLDTRHLERIGGLDHALDQEGEEVISGTPVAVAERVFKRLTDTDPQKRRVRRPARRSELLAIANADAAVVDALLARCAAEGTNFVFASPDGQPDDPRYSIAHESLIRQWDRLRRWVDDEQALRDWYLGIAREVAAWRADRSLPLLSAQATRVAREMLAGHSTSAEWAARYPDAAATFAEVTAFIAESHHANERERRRRRNLLGGVAAVVALAASVVMWSGLRAERALRNAEALGFTSAIDRLIEDDPTYAVALATEFDSGAAWDGARKEQVLRALEQPTALAEFHGIVTLFLSRDGQRVALLRADGSVVVRAADGTGGPGVEVSREGNRAAAFDSAGNLWTITGDSTRVLRRTGITRPKAVVLPTKAPLTHFTMSKGGGWAIAIDSLRDLYVSRTSSPAFRKIGNAGPRFSGWFLHDFLDHLLFLGDSTGAVTLINLEAAQPLTTLRPAESGDAIATAISTSADGRQVLISRESGRPDLYTLSTDLRRAGAPESWRGREVSSAALSADGTLVVAGFASGRVSLHRRLRKEAVWYRDTPDEAPHVTFSPHPDWIMVSSPFGTIRLLHREEKTVDIVLRGHRGALLPALSSLDGARLATLDANGVARVWDPWRRHGQHGLPVVWPRGTQLVLSASGTQLIASSPGGEIAAYPLDAPNATVSRVVAPMLNGTAAAEILAVSTRGELALVRSARVGAQLWRVGGTVEPVDPSLPYVSSGQFTPDGAMLVVAVEPSELRAYDVVGRRATPRVFRGVNVSSARVTSDSRSIVYATGTALLQGNLRTGAVDTLAQWPEPEFTEPVIATSRTGGAVLLGFDDDAGLFSNGAGTEALSFEHGVSAAAFSPSARWLATAPVDLAAVLHRLPLDAADPHVQQLLGFRQLVLHLAFSSDDSLLVTTGESGEVRLWTLRDTASLELTLQHRPRLSYSETMASAQSVIVGSGPEIRSVVRADDQQPRVRYWPLSPNTLHQLLRSATNVCLPLEVRRRVLSTEFEDDAVKRTERCEALAATSR